jgi:hypothetical protein
MIEITAIRFRGGHGHEHITNVMWRCATTSVGHTTAQAIVEWLSATGESEVVVADGADWVCVTVARPLDQPPYIRTRIDGVWTDHLLSLPTF